MAGPRDWIVAIGDVEPGGTLTVSAATFFGPYTANQAAQISFAGDGFPDGTKEVWVFQVDRTPSAKRLLKGISQAVAIAQSQEGG